MSFQTYIREMVQVIGTVMNQDERKASISRKALSLADFIVIDMCQDIVREAKRHMVAANRRTLMPLDIQGAVLQRLHGEVARYAVAEAAKAVTSYDLEKRDWGIICYCMEDF